MSVEILSWAILDAKGNPICDYDSIDDLGEDTSAVVPVEPQENGALYAYDKVVQPQQITVTLLFSGDYAAQEAAIARIDAALRGFGGVHRGHADHGTLEHDAGRRQLDPLLYGRSEPALG